MTRRAKSARAREQSALSYANRYLSGGGKVRTNCLTGTRGMTDSTRCSAVWFIRLPQHVGHSARDLHVNGTSCRASHVAQRMWVKPLLDLPTSEKGLRRALDERRDVLVVAADVVDELREVLVDDLPEW